MGFKVKEISRGSSHEASMASYELAPLTTVATNRIEAASDENLESVRDEPRDGNVDTLSGMHAEQKEKLVTSAAEADLAEHHSQDSTRGRIRSAWNRYSSLLTDSWIPEIASLATSVALLIGLAILFLVWQGHHTAIWSAQLSFPTVVAIVAKASQATLMVPVASSMSQMGWMHFQKEEAVIDFQRFDAATRSPLGNLRLLWFVRTGTVLLSFLIVVPGLGFEAAAQQCLQVVGPTLIPILAQICELDDISNNDGIIADGLMGATMQALTNPNSGMSTTVPLVRMIPDGNTRTEVVLPRTLDYTCTTPNCVPRPYATMGLCSSCDDITDEIVTLPSGFKGLSSGAGFSSQEQLLAMIPHPISYDYSSSWSGTLALANFSLLEYVLLGTENAQYQYQFVETLVAQRCVINVCANIYQLDVSGGSTGASGANETLLASVTQMSGGGGSWSLAVPEGTALEYPNRRVAKWQGGPSGAFGSTSPGYGTFTGDYGIDNASLVLLSSYFASLFDGSSSWSWLNTNTPANVSAYAQSPAGTEYWDSFSGTVTTYNFESYDDVITQIGGTVSNIATSMGNWLRDFYFSTVPGRCNPREYSGVTENTYHIQWAWFVLPMAVELFAVCLIASTIRKTRKANLPIWKTSSIATMFRGLPQPEDQRVSDLARVSNMEDLATRKKVRLAMTLQGYRLVDIEKEHLP